jgi:Lrp/AsnC family leucine-responsive transcriptional regulator
LFDFLTLLQLMKEFDRIDDQILRALASDARISNVVLAQKVGLSPSACLRRVQDLERSGVISGYHARIDRKSLGRHFLAYMTVGLSSQKKSAHEAFERAIAAASQVTECHNVTGSFEYLLRVEVADLDAFKEFHTDVLGSLPDVASIVSLVVMASPKDDRV